MHIRHSVGLASAVLVVSAAALPFLPAKQQDVAAQFDAPAPATAPTDRSPEEYQGSFFYSTAQEMLSALNVTVHPEDKVYAFPDPSLGIGSTVKVYRAQSVTIKDGADEKTVRTWAHTVRELADEQRLNLGDKDVVEPPADSVLPADAASAVTITRVAETEVSVNSSIDYSTQYKDDPEMERGSKVTEQVGKPGTLQTTYRVRRENGQEVSRVVISKKTTVQPTPEIIRRGTKIVTYGTGQASWYGGVPAMTAAHLNLPFGTKVKVVNLANGKSVVVTIADRGPFVAGRIIDLSSDAFAAIASTGTGVISVSLEKAE